MVKLDRFNIDFDCNKSTPFFQSEPNYRIRFDIDKLENTTLQGLLNMIYDQNEEIEMIFISEYIINGKRISSKSNINKIITIKNWREIPVFDEETNEGVVYANIKRLKQSDVFNYCIAVKRGFREIYLSFFSDTYMVYVSSDVIDIISNDESKVNILKESYNELYDKHYETN
ncbi:hypothetical protein B857_00582 [Solibacillus isronensis B3W22]|uniref:Uncharacterized protein n=1 Tax=Solibacillus isronensis B3W22 TaxID=1224748 RepID=K1L2Q9_9BACL|nr:hypothetical protein [Solibacillus isronensis]AMO85724.1 hypothetical protein SOLI23_09030 [Solibacillus silvestris]EKB46372.1 hypothetical protein B857_00582 [Solibacillus isronensis B3W22]